MQRSLGVLAALTLALAGCGGGDDNESSGEASGTKGTSVSITARDFELDPENVTLDAAGTYTFTLTNDGGATHALEIEGNGVEAETDEIGPGDTAEVTVDLSEGDYELYCPVDGHRQQGMEGRIVVGGSG